MIAGADRRAGRHRQLRRSVHLGEAARRASPTTASATRIARVERSGRRGPPHAHARSLHEPDPRRAGRRHRRRGAGAWPNGCAARSAASRSAATCSRPKGPRFVRELVARGDRVFLDLKFHDIPNTVAGAVRAAASLGVWMVNVHASGGADDDAGGAGRGRRGRATRPAPPLVIAVTVLTSFDRGDAARDIGVDRPIAAQVEQLARADAGRRARRRRRLAARDRRHPRALRPRIPRS